MKSSVVIGAYIYAVALRTITNDAIGNKIMTDSNKNFESNSETKRKKGNPAWQKGMASPNAGGRPREVGDMRELAKSYTEAAVRTLATVMNDESVSPSARAAAACAILDRAYGRPSQSIETRVDIAVDVATAHAATLMRLAEQARHKKEEASRVLELTAN